MWLCVNTVVLMCGKRFPTGLISVICGYVGMNSFSKELFGTEAKSLVSQLQSKQGQPRVSFEVRSVEGRSVVNMKLEWD